jgi:hypothetical protein
MAVAGGEDTTGEVSEKNVSWTELFFLCYLDGFVGFFFLCAYVAGVLF